MPRDHRRWYLNAASTTFPMQVQNELGLIPGRSHNCVDLVPFLVRPVREAILQLGTEVRRSSRSPRVLGLFSESLDDPNERRNRSEGGPNISRERPSRFHA